MRHERSFLLQDYYFLFSLLERERDALLPKED
jgi:hypothetical protein